MGLNDTSVRIKIIKSLQQAGVGFKIISKILKGGSPPVRNRFFGNGVERGGRLHSPPNPPP